MSNLVSVVKLKLRNRMWQWLAKRQPASREVQLNQKILFVFPTRFGFSTLVLVVLFYILGTNYQNNLILMLGYVLLSLLLICIGLSYLNLAGLKLVAGKEQAGFVDESLMIPVQIDAIGKRFAIQGGFVEQPTILLTEAHTTLSLQLHKRGLFPIPRIKLSSEYPFGLIRTWCYVSLAQNYWAYPAPKRNSTNQHAGDGDLTGDLAWHHLSSYLPGDPIKNIDWKKLARQPLQPVVKQYRPESYDVDFWIELQDGALEVELSRLCAEVLACEARQQNYGVRLPNLSLAPNHGPQHQLKVLQALALC